MSEFTKYGKKLRNFSLVLIFFAILILFIWIVVYLTISEKEFLYLAIIGITLLFAGILILTRIQYVLWLEKRATL